MEGKVNRVTAPGHRVSAFTVLPRLIIRFTGCGRTHALETSMHLNDTPQVDRRWIRAAQRLFPVCGAVALLAIGAVWGAVFWLIWCLGFLVMTRSAWYKANVVARFGNPDTAIFIDVVALTVCPILLAVDINNLSAAVSLLVSMIGLQLLGAAFRNAPRLGLFCASPTVVPLVLALSDRSMSTDVLILGGLTLLGFGTFFGPAWIFFCDDRSRVERSHQAQLATLGAAQNAADHAVAELGRQVEHLQAVLASVPAGVAIYDEDDRLLTWNGGYSRAARDGSIKLVQGRTFVELVTPAIESSTGGTGSDSRSAISRRLAGRKSGRTILQRQTNGRWYQLRDRKLPSGGIVSISVDITDLKIREELASALFDRNPVPLWIVDPADQSFMRVNDALIALFGWSREEFMALKVWDLLNPGEHEAFLADTAAIVEDGLLSPKPLSCRTRTGEEVLIKSQAAMVTTVDGKTGRMRALWDVTAQVQAEKRLLRKTKEAARARKQAERSSAAKSDFLAMMSHELRTPLNGVLGTAQALALTPLAQDQSDQVQTILQSGRGLKTVLNAVLDLSKIEAGRMDIVPGPVDVTDLLASLAGLWQAVSDDKGVSFTLIVEADFPPLISADGQRLRQITSNLISNALKFTDAGEITVVASCTTGAPGTFTISVTDTGIGMSADEQGRLFKAFNQLNTGSARAFEGTGLGLVICKQLATLMGGDVSVVSAPGVGSTFSVTLPLIAVVAAEAGEVEPEIELPTQCAILVAEDNLTNQAVVRALLGGFGWELTFADNGAKAVEACRAGHYDLILMDIHMPVMDGLEATRTIRRLRSEMARVPIIALTADASNGDRQRFLNSGFDGHVAKPIEMDALLRGIAGVLGAKVPCPEGARRADLDEPLVA